MHTLRTAILVAALTSFGALPAMAADAAPPCVLKQLADVPMETQPDGRITIPIMVNDTRRDFMVDIGASVSAITAVTANALSLRQRRSNIAMELFGGRIMNSFAKADTFKIDRLSATDFPLIVIPTDASPIDSDGLLGADVMSSYDIDIDYAAERFKLFAPGSCSGNPVYWTKTAPFARVPITVTASRHVSVPVQLDGVALAAVADTGAETSAMSVELAKRLFHLADNDPRLKERGAYSINGNPASRLYSFPFQTLTFEGIQVKNPDIVLLPAASMGIGVPQLLMGAGILRQLHLYISYRENMLYLTGAEAR